MLEMLADTDTLIAVVGATDDPGKYGSIIYRDLKRKGYDVVGVNPNRTSVDGDPVYPALADLPAPPHIIDVVVPPPVALRVIEDAIELGLDHIWLQPGAESPQALALLQREGIDHIAHSCIMVETRRALRGG